LSEDTPTQEDLGGPDRFGDGEEADLGRLLQHMRATRGFDFTGYKTSSLTRRIRRRMQVVHSTTFDEYRRYLDDNPEEFIELFNTILINVTGFFRDPETWSRVRESVIPKIAGEPGSDDPLRVWVAGCATGEEPFTIAILLCEALGDDAFRRRVKIYATDVDQEAITEARHGRYLKRTIGEDLPVALLDRYFEPDGAYVMFRKDLRRTVIFGRHDLVQDPPISRIDLLSCRNTLMYFNPPAQARILANLRFALRPNGFLVLGRSEALASRNAEFTAVDPKSRIFRRTPTRREQLMSDDPRPAPPAQPVPDPPAADVRSLGFELGTSAQILQDLELLYRPLELRSRLDALYAERHPVAVRAVEWRRGAEVTWLDVLLHPIVNHAGVVEGTSVTFVDVTPQRRLQDELQGSRVQLETAYEELQSAVEELETTNEELQSTNEELETTNEELQSTNEELETINDEFRLRTTELHEINNVLEAILTSLNSAVVVVDRDVRIQVWNRHAQDLWGLRRDEVEGEHLMNLDIGLPVEHLHQPIRACLTGEPPQPVAMPAVNRRGRVHRLRGAGHPTGRCRGCGHRGDRADGRARRCVRVRWIADRARGSERRVRRPRLVAAQRIGYDLRRLIVRRVGVPGGSRSGDLVCRVDPWVCADAREGRADRCPSSCASASTGTSNRSMPRSSGCSQSSANGWRRRPTRS
jgi:two-component system, chemotaxis family, CheB/CheR fusion protein